MSMAAQAFVFVRELSGPPILRQFSATKMAVNCPFVSPSFS